MDLKPLHEWLEQCCAELDAPRDIYRLLQLPRFDPAEGREPNRQAAKALKILKEIQFRLPGTQGRMAGQLQVLVQKAAELFAHNGREARKAYDAELVASLFRQYSAERNPDHRADDGETSAWLRQQDVHPARLDEVARRFAELAASKPYTGVTDPPPLPAMPQPTMLKSPSDSIPPAESAELLPPEHNVPERNHFAHSVPGCLVWLIDQSRSMRELIDDEGAARPHWELAAHSINRFLTALVGECSRRRIARPPLQIAVIGYCTTSMALPQIAPILRESSVNEPLVELSTLVQRTSAAVAGSGASEPRWIEPHAFGGTPLCAALAYCQSLIGRWIEQHATGRPPWLIHWTDGAPRDGDPRPAADTLKSLHTSQGPVCFVNISRSPHRTPDTGGPQPGSSTGLPHEALASLFYEMSSDWPKAFHERLEHESEEGLWLSKRALITSSRQVAAFLKVLLQLQFQKNEESTGR